MGVRALFLAIALTGLACKPTARTSNPELADANDHKDILAMHASLEQLIDANADAESDREYAYKQASKIPDDGSAAYAYARAAIVGRYTEMKGLKAMWLVKQMESLARKSIKRDPAYDDAAARRMLGSLYVMAGDHTEHGDSEKGLELLEELVDENSEDPRNRLRLAEGYVFLGDPEGAFEHLCVADGGKAQLRPSEARLLEKLFKEIGGRAEAGCDGGS